MLRLDDPWFLDETGDEDEGGDEFVEMLKALPELRQLLVPAPPEEEVGLRSLLERPDTFAHAWWGDQTRRSGRTSEPTLRPARPHAA